MKMQQALPEKLTYTATETAQILGISVEAVLRGIENGTLPVGVAVRPETSRERWKCKVFKARLDKYLKGEI